MLFHGGVASKERRDLITQFKQDPDCRLFLSTDAGGVGLNLQNASTVVNMDLPWNPAVLDQRVGRVHRLGQHRPVRVVNFVAQGTIEQGMLSVLSFKQSMFAGVLDGGANEVFLGGSRLKRFMDSVDKVTQAIPAAMPSEEKDEGELEQAVDEDQAAEQLAVPAEAARAGAGPEPVEGTHGLSRAAEPDWQNLITAGLTLLNRLSGAASGEGKTPAGSGPRLKIETDEATGERHLKLPVPSGEVLRGIASLLTQLAEKL